MDKILEFIKVSKLDLNNDKNYCVIVYKTIGPLSRDLIFIYKNIDEFESKVREDIKNINKMFGIEFQIWKFD